MVRSSVLAWLRLARVFQKIDHASLAHLRDWDLNVAQFDVLTQVAVAQGITQQELAKKLLVTKGNISQLLDRMELHGLILRIQVGRRNLLSLTVKGQRLAAQVVPMQEEMIAQQFSALSPQEVDQLLALLRKLDRALE